MKLGSKNANDRRGFLGILAFLGLGAWVGPDNPQIDPEGYPTPSYLPPGYKFVAVRFSEPDGFGGKTEKLFSYWNSTSELRIAISRDPQHPFGGTREHEPAGTLFLQTKSGAHVEAQYWDGFWRQDPNGTRVVRGYKYAWDVNDIHIIVFRLGDFHIGLRARRKGGVSLEELVKISSSMCE